MASPDPEDVLTAVRDGVTVEKSFEPDDFPVPAIAFVFRSDRDEPVSVRLVDGVPENVSPENIGFHPEYGAEFWGVVDDGIAFEREFAPGEEYTTVYGLRGDDTDVPSKFLSDPRIKSVTPPLDGGVGSDSDTDAEADPHDGTDADGHDDDAGNEDHDDADIDADDRGDDTEADGAESDDRDDDAEAPTEVDPGPAAAGSDDDTDTVSIDTDDDPEAAEDTAGVPAPGPDDRDAETGSSEGNDPAVGPADGRQGDASVVGELVAELEAADPDDPEIVALREALGINLTRATVEARIDHLQSAVADLEAYTDALEAFLDENGDAQRVLGDIRERHERTEERLDGIEATAEAADESARSAETRLDDEFGDVRKEIDALEAEIESLSEELSEVVEMRKRLTEALGGIAGEDASDGD